MKKIIDLGCGTGNELKQYYPNYSVVGIDLDEENIALCTSAMPDGEWRVGDITNIDLSQYTNVEKVICTEVLEHVDDWKAGVASISTAPSGTQLYLTVPHKKSEEKLIAQRPKYWSEIGHQHFFDGSELKTELENNGWTDIRIRRWNAALYFELSLLFKKNAKCIRNTYYENNLPLPVKLFFQLFRENLFQTKLKFIPLWIITLPLARLIDPIYGAGIEITATKA